MRSSSLRRFLRSRLCTASTKVPDTSTTAECKLGQFAAHLLGEIEADRDTLRGIADSVGAGTNALNEIGAWAEEKSAG
jgi:hypothetical protein